MNKDFLLALLAFLLACCLVLPAWTYASGVEQNDDAVMVIDTFNNALLSSLKGGEKLGYSGRYALLEPIMRRTFNFSFMLEKSCGRFWEEMDSQQRGQLLEKYITWSVGTYALRFDKYDGQRFTILSSEQLGRRYVQVSSTLIKTGKENDFNYLLIQDEDGWRIVDIKVEGVSQLAVTRSQFRSILKKDGVAGLLQRLDEKIRNLVDEPNKG